MHLVVLTGPTASGKTRVALEVGRRIPVEIVNLDSRKVYRGMDIGTDKPSPQERALVLHHLIDIREPSQPFSVYDFLRELRQLVPEIWRRHHLPLAVGGTMMYLKALASGYTLGPPPFSEEERARLLEEERRAPGTLYRLALQRNPERARQLSPRDLPRLLRAIEGVPAEKRQEEPPFPVHIYALIPERRWLYQRIEQRVQDQIARGLVEEVRQLYLKYGPHCRALRAIAYQEFLPYFEGKITLEEAIQRLIQDNKRLVRHQLTWLRKIPHTAVPVAPEETPAQIAERLIRLWRLAGLLPEQKETQESQQHEKATQGEDEASEAQ